MTPLDPFSLDWFSIGFGAGFVIAIIYAAWEVRNQLQKRFPEIFKK